MSTVVAHSPITSLRTVKAVLFSVFVFMHKKEFKTGVGVEREIHG